MQVIKPKGRGSGLMVSDLIMSTSMHRAVTEKDPTVPQSARVILEYGKKP